MAEHTHQLRDIFRIDGQLDDIVVSWCPTCGAVAVDAEIDGRTDPGAHVAMKFPKSAKGSSPCGVAHAYEPEE